MRSAFAPLVVLAGTLAASPSASAATLTTTRCTAERNTVIVTGAGFAPSSLVSVKLDGEPFRSAATDAGGTFSGTFDSERLPGKVRQRVHLLTATDAAGTSASRGYRVTKVLADFSPDSGDVASLRVRFTVRGFGVLRREPSVWLHYVDPRGRSVRDVRLGRARGTCGTIRRTRKRTLFPFDARRGRWVLQFDTRKTYRRGRRSSTFIWVRTPVEVFSRP